MTYRFPMPRILVAALFAVPLLAGSPFAAPMNDPVYFVILGEPETFADEFKPMPPESHRQIASGVMVYTLKTPIKDLRAQVEQSLDKAEKTGYPVLIHLDDWNFPPPSSDPELVEWTGWPAPGQTHGPLVKRRWIDWGAWFISEAPRNYESPKLRADITDRLKNGVLPPIISRLKKWKAAGREYLFAGLVVGWESGFYTTNGLGVNKLDPKRRPTCDGQTFGDDEYVGTGYAALTARGYNADSIKRLARTKGITETRAIHDLMGDVVRDYSTFWARVCSKSGIPKDRIYTHFTAVTSLPESLALAPLREQGHVLPLKAAVNPFSRPGVTVWYGTCDIDVTARTFRELKHPAWGAVEMEITAPTRTEQGAYQMLNHLTEAGAKVMCIFGWWSQKGTMFEAKTPGAIKAMHRWLGK